MRDRSMTTTVRIDDLLNDFVAENIGSSGAYENVSEYIRDLICRDKECVEHLTFETLTADMIIACPNSQGNV